MRGLAIGAMMAVACAGCFSDRGLAIEVDVGDTGATSVELYLGEQRCESGNDARIDCKAIGPSPRGTGALTGEVWFRDKLLPYTAEVKGRTATFQLRSDTTVTIPVMIAVGLAPGRDGGLATATLRDVEVPANRARIVTAALVAAGELQPGDPDTANLTEDRVRVWKKNAPASSCVVVEHWDRGQVTRTFVVPLEDPDCDDLQGECNPAAYHGASPGGTAVRPDCFTSSQQPACVLGSHGCTDDGPKDGTCGPQRSQVCVPDAFCRDCNDDLEGPCTRNRLETDPTIPHVVCFVPAQRPLLDVCPGKQSGEIDLDAFYQGGKCEQLALASLQLTGTGASHDFGGVKMELSSPRAPCNFTITWKTGARNTPDEMDLGVIRVATSEKALLLPIKFVFAPVPDCLDIGAEFACHVEGDLDDALWSCTP